jgi:phosphopantothenoylcysteine decarboxylase / phosphopantothenate---cysteine ligase
MTKQKEVVLGVTASVAIYKSCDIIRRIREQGHAVTVVATAESEELIKPILFESLSGRKVCRGLFQETAAWEIGHVALADKADLVLVAPATANCIAKIACGICDDLLTCVIAATRAPKLICPAMNEGMYTNKITQGNIAKLQSVGFHFVAPRKGTLACGRMGVGCLADVDVIVKETVRMLSIKA